MNTQKKIDELNECVSQFNDGLITFIEVVTKCLSLVDEDDKFITIDGWEDSNQKIFLHVRAIVQEEDFKSWFGNKWPL